MNNTDINLVSVKETRFEKKENSKTKGFFNKLAKGLMVPVALLPIAGLLLGVGASIAGNTDSLSWEIFGQILRYTGKVVFDNLAILFAIALAIAYTDDAGIAAFSAVVMFFAMMLIQEALLYEVSVTDPITGDPVLDSDGNHLYYINALFYVDISQSATTTAFGIEQLNTGVFGGFIVGGMTAWAYNKFHKIKLPAALGFYGGTRFVPIVSMFIGVWIGLVFLLIWPIFAQWFEAAGNAIATLPGGSGSFLYGLLDRLLLPFGLHHVVNAVLRTTPAGGTAIFYDAASATTNAIYGSELIYTGFLDYQVSVTPTMDSNVIDINSADSSIAAIDAFQQAGYIGDWQYYLDPESGNAVIMTPNMVPGQTRIGKYPVMLLGLPAAGLGMILATDKGKNREVAWSVIGTAVLTIFLTGITEPLEFTFLFIAPLLYLAHAFLYAFGYMFAELSGAIIGLGSGGIIDFVLQGIVIDPSGADNHWFFAPLIGAVQAVFYLPIFYFSVKKFNLATPGNGTDKLVSKSDFNNSKKSKNGKDRTERVNKLVEGIGGLDNIKTVDACFTRLRMTLNDRSKLNEQTMKDLGATGVVGKGTSVQVIFGGEADIFKTEIRELKNK